jgi:hypothetical protein
MHRHRILTTATLVALATVVAGCGIADPYASRRTTSTSTANPPVTTTTATVRDLDPVAERGGTIPRSVKNTQNKVAATAGQTNPRTALDRYAHLYINWTATTVAHVQRQLASISLDQARAQALQAAASYEHDTTLLSSHVANTGQVISIAAGEGTASGRWVIVTSEITSGQRDYQGLPAQLHVTYAQLTKTAARWVVSEWSPQT